MTLSSPTLERILVALDASPPSQAALEAAAQLALDYDAVLQGLFIEDETLKQAAESPFATEVRGFTRRPTQLHSGRLRRQLREQAERAEASLYRLSEQTGLTYDFDVAQGPVAATLRDAAHDADLVAAGKTSRRTSFKRLGTTARRLLSDVPAPLLLLRRPPRIQRPLVTIYDGSDAAEATLAMAVSLARHAAGSPLTVFLPGRSVADTSALERRARARYGHALTRLNIRLTPHADAARLAAAAERERASLVVVPHTSPSLSARALTPFLAAIDTPVLVVR